MGRRPGACAESLPVVVLGIDPGTASTGYGVVRAEGSRLHALEEGVISLEQAVRSASGLPADILHLKERGYLKKGYFADVVVFDPKTFRDRATFDHPHVYATGVQHLFVNGAPVVREGRYLNVLAGKPLVRQEHERGQAVKRGMPPS